MGKSAPTPPAAPDPTVVAAAQTASNDQTAELQSQLNNMNYAGPQGSVNYTQSSNPSDPQWTEKVNLSPAEQSLFDQTTTAENGALSIANNQLGRVSNALGQGVTPGAGMTTAAPQGWQSLISTPGYDANQSSFNPGQAVQGQIGPSNFGNAVDQTVNSQFGAGYQLLQPQMQQAAEQEQAQLTAQGLNPNDAAYQNAMTLFGNQQGTQLSQLANASVQSGNAEQQALFNEQGQQGQFANQAAAQQYAQNQGQAGFYNNAVNQDFANKLNYSNLYNSAEGQSFNQQLAAGQFQNQAQQQAFQQGAYAQELPINELDALLSSGQVAMPSGATYTPTSVAPTNVENAYALNSNVAEQNYQAQLQNNTSTLGGLFNLGSAAIKLSDRRLKTDVRRIGRTDSGLPLYLFRFKGHPELHVGVMAQEVRETRPDLVRQAPEGWLMVNYEGLAS